MGETEVSHYSNKQFDRGQKEKRPRQKHLGRKLRESMEEADFTWQGSAANYIKDHGHKWGIEDDQRP